MRPSIQQQLTELAVHRDRCCSKGCKWCAREKHLFEFEARVLAREDFIAWMEYWTKKFGGRSAERQFGGLETAWRAFQLVERGFDLSIGDFSCRKDLYMPPPRRQTKNKEESAVTLPDEISEISDDLNDYSFLIHGEKKIGKTTLGTVEKGVLDLSFDPYRPGLAILQRHVPDWKTLLQYVALLEQKVTDGEFEYKRVVLDRVDLAATSCLRYICKKRNINDPQDEEWGTAWRALKQEFNAVILRLLALPCGVWFISHSDWKEVKSRSGVKSTKLVPDLTGWAEEILNGLVDGWFAYDYEGDERVLLILGNEMIGAGHAIDTHFRTPDGERVREIPMGRRLRLGHAGEAIAQRVHHELGGGEHGNDFAGGRII